MIDPESLVSALCQRMVSDGRRRGRDPLVLARSARHHPARHLPDPAAARPHLARGPLRDRRRPRFRRGHGRPARRSIAIRTTPARGSARRSSTATSRSIARGLAHSVEAWRDGQLVGGLYGVSLGGAFFGESMFHRETDASKIALVALVERLQRAWLRAARHAVVDAPSRAVRRDRDSAPRVPAPARSGAARDVHVRLTTPRRAARTRQCTV